MPMTTMMPMAAVQPAPTANTQPSSTNKTSMSDKGASGDFSKKLDQTMKSANSKSDVDQNKADPVNNTDTQAVESDAADKSQATESMDSTAETKATQTLSENPTEEELAAFVESLLAQLGEMKDADQDEPVTSEDMTGILGDLDNLLAMLESIPQLQQAIQTQQAVDVTAAASGEETAIGALQGMLKELQAVLQQDKTGAISKDMMTAITKQVKTVDQAVNGTNAAPAIQSGGADEASTASVPAQSSHLHRMGAQLLHASVLTTVVPTEEATSAESAVAAPAQETASTEGTIVPIAVTTPDNQPRLEPTGKLVMPQPVPAEKFAETMKDMMVNQFNVKTKDGLSEATISLAPAHLGQVDIRIAVQNGQLTAVFVAESAAAKDMLENQIAQLRNQLQTQGLQVERLEVTQSSNAFESNMFHSGNGKGARDQHSTKQGGSNRDAVNEINGYNPEAEQAAVEQAVTRTLGFGREINTTA
ncbi:flagellar hook-length control protein FliK [Paenibacillus methanolicus]|uniref:Flagellar hook-length control protein FliK n=1 Tax=Paenibacillus methanolicus TaxID=582686 RepID=A0A5S5CGM5_9BACL|nr:flagellar hook-length control protein FliK [Paenibacillus methanolicus]TYP77652.1 flagellar hook-length control protein FliK [Paenibacillus methanolicus]